MGRTPARAAAIVAWARTRAVRFETTTATSVKKNSAATFAGSAMVKV